MEYPGTKFTRPLRLVFFLFFVLLFLILSPIVILYATGYRYDWKKGFLRETGAISIDVLPKEAVVYLNGVKVNEKIPVRLNNVAPARYKVLISSAGYFDWSKEINVVNKQTQYIKDIRLIKDDDKSLVYDGKIDDFAVSPNGKHILFAQIINKKNEIHWLDTEKNTNKIILATTSPATFVLAWSPSNACATIKERTTAVKSLFIFCPEENNSLKILEQKNQLIKKILWVDTNETELMFESSNTIFSHLPLTGNTRTVSRLPSTTLDWYTYKNKMWTLNKDTAGKPYFLTQDELGFPKYYDTEITTDNNSFILTAGDGFALIEKGNNKCVIVSASSQDEISCENYYLSPYNQWLLVWSQFEIWTFANGEKPRLFTRSGEKVNHVVPLDEFNTLAIIGENSSRLIFPYYFVEQNWFEHAISNVGVDRTNKMFYFTAKILGKEGLWKISY